MKIEDFDFELNPARIAQRPLEPRDGSKLLVCEAAGRLGDHTADFSYSHATFRDIAADAPWSLGAGDFLVMNDARVLPVRMLGHRESGGSVEALLLRRNGVLEWSALMHMSARARPGLTIIFEPGVVAEVLSTHEERLATEGEVRLRFSGLALEGAGGGPGLDSNERERRFEQWLERHGHVPLPPYIERADSAEDKKTYQTVYAARTGSAAAPTAGFHFTDQLLERLAAKGVSRATVTLHVGLGTFRPIKTEKVEDHAMHEERFEIGPGFLESYAQARRAGRRLVAVGTTVVRTLESWAAQCEERGIEPGSPESAGAFSTRAYIYPGHRFRVVDDLITNFHLPRSTLLVLVAAAMGPRGIEAMKSAYAQALASNYRFFSYGDAMFIRGRK